MAPGLLGRGSRGLLCQVCTSESEKDGISQSKKGSQEEKACRGRRQEETNGIPPTAPEQGTSRGCHSFGGY